MQKCRKARSAHFRKEKWRLYPRPRSARLRLNPRPRPKVGAVQKQKTQSEPKAKIDTAENESIETESKAKAKVTKVKEEKAEAEPKAKARKKKKLPPKENEKAQKKDTEQPKKSVKKVAVKQKAESRAPKEVSETAMEIDALVEKADTTPKSNVTEQKPSEVSKVDDIKTDPSKKEKSGADPKATVVESTEQQVSGAPTPVVAKEEKPESTSIIQEDAEMADVSNIPVSNVSQMESVPMNITETGDENDLRAPNAKPMPERKHCNR